MSGTAGHDAGALLRRVSAAPGELKICYNFHKHYE